MKEANNIQLYKDTIELSNNALGRILEFLPHSALKNTALVNSVWHTISAQALPRVEYYTQLANCKAMVGPRLYREMANTHSNPTHLIQFFKALNDQVTTARKQYNDNIIKYLTDAMIERPSYISLLLVAIAFKKDPPLISRLLSHLDTFPLRDHLTDELKKQVTLLAVNQRGFSLLLAPEQFKNDREIVLAAVSQNGRVLKDALITFKNNKKVVLAAVSQNGFALKYAADECKNDKEVVLAAVSQNGFALKYAADECKNDKEVVLAAVNQNGFALKYAADEFKNDKKVLLAAVSQNGFALKYATDEFKNDKEVVLAAVSQNGFVLKYAADACKNDKEVVLAAVGQNGRMLHYAPAAFKKDREIVLAAVGQNGWALEYTSATLKNDKVVVLAALNQNGFAFHYASTALQKDPGFRVVAGRASLIGYVRSYFTVTANKFHLISSQCRDFITIKELEAWQASQYGLLLGIAIGGVAGIVGALLIAGAVVPTLWCLGLLAGCMLAGAVIGATMGSLIDQRFHKPVSGITQEEKPLVNCANKRVEAKKQAHLLKSYYKPFFLSSSESIQVEPANCNESDNFSISEHRLSSRL